MRKRHKNASVNTETNRYNFIKMNIHFLGEDWRFNLTQYYIFDRTLLLIHTCCMVSISAQPGRVCWLMIWTSNWKGNLYSETTPWMRRWNLKASEIILVSLVLNNNSETWLQIEGELHKMCDSHKCCLQSS